MRGPPPPHMQHQGRPMSPANGRNSPGPRMRGPPPNGRQSPSPYGPPPNGRQSPSPYGGPQGRPMSPGFPNAPRPLSPGGRPAHGGRARNSSDPFARGGRPMSPAGSRPRSNSQSNMNQGGRMPAGPSRMNPNAGGSPPMQSSPQYGQEQAPMVLRNVGGGQPQFAGGPGPSSPPQQQVKAVARKPAPGQAM